MSGGPKVRGRVSRPRRCALCHDDLGPIPVVCPRCGTAVHPECHRELGGCPTIGCRAAAPASRVLDPVERASLPAAWFWTFCGSLVTLVMVRDALGHFMGDTLRDLITVVIVPTFWANFLRVKRGGRTGWAMPIRVGAVVVLLEFLLAPLIGALAMLPAGGSGQDPQRTAELFRVVVALNVPVIAILAALGHELLAKLLSRDRR